jgi:hypothetical protein
MDKPMFDAAWIEAQIAALSEQRDKFHALWLQACGALSLLEAMRDQVNEVSARAESEADDVHDRD